MKYFAISLLFLLPSLSDAKPNKEAAKQKKQTTPKATKGKKKAKKNAFRGNKAKLAPGTLKLSVNGKKHELSKKKEDEVSAAKTHRQIIMQKQKKSPHDSAIAAMKAKANELSKKNHGRIRINYTIGMNGKPKNVMVMGYSDKIDDALTKVLEGWQMSRRQAGQMVATRIDVFPPNKIAQKSKKKKPRKVARK